MAAPMAAMLSQANPDQKRCRGAGVCAPSRDRVTDRRPYWVSTAGQLSLALAMLPGMSLAQRDWILAS